MKFKDSVRINVTFPRAFLDSLDGWAKATNRSRSGFLREAVRRYIIYLVRKGNHETDL